jgi:hypothetical protein
VRGVRPRRLDHRPVTLSAALGRAGGHRRCDWRGCRGQPLGLRSARQDVRDADQSETGDPGHDPGAGGQGPSRAAAEERDARARPGPGLDRHPLVLVPVSQCRAKEPVAEEPSLEPGAALLEAEQSEDQPDRGRPAWNDHADQSRGYEQEPQGGPGTASPTHASVCLNVRRTPRTSWRRLDRGDYDASSKTGRLARTSRASIGFSTIASLWILPSRKRMIRLQWRAISSSWVTTTTVFPCRLRS